ncbi:MAG: hypothetical protein H6974_03510 [Gammaproteobacteria bacterium]|nr:hypothetical protein [Gammaproteobacteria bacterium]
MNQPIGGKVSAVCLSPSRVDLFLIVLAAILTDIPFFTHNYLLAHDLLEIFSYYNYLYSGLLQDQAIPLWYPWVLYGMRMDIALFGLTPFVYIFTLLGYLIGYEETATLLFLSLTAERIFFAVSLYYLSLILYRSRITSVSVSVLGAVTLFWFWTPAFNLHTISFVPLSLFLLVRFAITGFWHYLWMCGIILSVSMTFALAAIMMICLSAIVLTWCVQQPNLRFLPSKPSLTTTLTFLLCVVLVIANRVFLGDALANLDVLAPSRAQDGTVSLRTFLNYGVASTLDVAVQAFILGYRPTANWSSYIGLLPLFGALTGMALAKCTAARALTAGAFVLILMTNASGVAALFFHFPAMEYFRHLQHLFPLLKVFLLILAGFSFDRMAVMATYSESLRCWLTPWSLILATLVFLAVVDGAAGPLLRVADDAAWAMFDSWKPATALGAILAIQLSYARVLVYGIMGLLAVMAVRFPGLSGERRALMCKALLLIAVSFDIASYQWQCFQQWHWSTTDDPVILSTFKAMPTELAWQREREPMGDRQTKIIATFAQQAHDLKGANYASFEALAAFDRCFPSARVPWLAAGLAHLIQLRGGILVPGATGSTVPWDDVSLMKILGCESSKFRLVANALFADSVLERDQWIQQTANLDNLVILGPLSDSSPLSPGSSNHPPVNGNIALIHYEANWMVLEVDNPASYPVWLVYADAFDKGWQASVDGQPVTIYEAYGAFKAVSAPPGRSRVIWRYHSSLTVWVILLMRLLTGLAGLAAIVSLMIAPRLGWRFIGQNAS